MEKEKVRVANVHGLPDDGAIRGEKSSKFFTHEEVVNTLRAAMPWFRIEDCRADFIVQGSEFAHPDAAAPMSGGDVTASAFRTQLHIPLEEHRAFRAKTQDYMEKVVFAENNASHPEWEAFGYWKKINGIKGCIEEPDAPENWALFRGLKEQFKKGPYPTLFVIPTGGLYFNSPYMWADAPATKFFGAQAFIPHFRSCIDAQYPAAINDLHAAYQYMVNHAEELNIDTDRIIIYGYSSGAHLASCLPFRLKRYDWCGAPMPRGVYCDDGMFDDRETTRSMRILSYTWSSLFNRGANMLYMGDNFASGLIGPEAFANHATVEECKGLPPYCITEGQYNVCCDPATEFVNKLNAAGVYCDYYIYGGCNHYAYARDDGSTFRMLFCAMPDMPSEYEPLSGYDASARLNHFQISCIKDFINNDMRRKVE